jgi:putative pyruvate formate lyase activating enzyme
MAGSAASVKLAGVTIERTAPRAVSRFVVDERPDPGYVTLLRTGELARRVRVALAELESCTVCPRDCRVDRLHALPAADAEVAAPASSPAGRSIPTHVPKGTACFTGRHPRVASVFPHFGEEECLRGWNGSGTIFLSFCNLRCVFCQNWDVSQVGEGRELGAEELAAAMLGLAAHGCHNVNFVTPEPAVPQILEGVLLAAEAGLRLPIVYNTSAYDSLRSLELLDGVVDVYMPDFKYWDPARARRYLKAEDYPEVTRRTIREMHRQVGPLRFDRDGLAVRGLLVRHLVMPDALEDAAAIVHFLATEISADTYLNVMDQYYPAGAVAEGKYPELGRRPAAATLSAARELATAAGLWRFDTRWRTALPRDGGLAARIFMASRG